MTSSVLRRMNLSGFSGVFALVALLAFWAAFPVTANAQRDYAAINGTIKDATGAVIPDATVVLEKTGTGVKRTVTTNAAGDYVLLDIPPGDYTLQVSKGGFATVMQSKFTLYVNQTATFDFTLAVGTTRQTVTVEATAAHIQASTSELGAVVTGRQVNELPLNGRNFTQLLSLTPGVTPVSIAQNNGGWFSSPIGSFTFPSVNGARNRSNLWLLDGINNQGAYISTYTVPPIVDSIQEFKVQSHNDEAQFGQALGGIVNVVTKSGTNSFHGSAWEFLRNDKLDARNLFISDVTPLRWNQFGGSIGGPVILPHYNGRNKTFFFASYEGFRQHQPAQNLGLVPTPLQLTGDLSDIPEQIYNPYSTRPDPSNPEQYLRDPFMCDVAGTPLPTNALGLQATGTPCNKLPSSLINAGDVLYATKLFPKPVDTGVPGTNMLDQTPSTTRQDEISVRIDQQIGDKNAAFFRFTGFWQPSIGSGGLTNTTRGVNDTNSYQVVGSWIHTFSGNSVLQASFGRVNQVSNGRSEFTSAVPKNLWQEAGISKDFACGFFGTDVCYNPSLTPDGYASAGEYISNNHPSSIYEGKADFSTVRGRHSFKMGADIAASGWDTTATGVAIVFTAFQTSDLATSAGGSSLASFLLGIPDNANRANTTGSLHGGWVHGFYFADQWRATDKLTVNWGLRYDITVWPYYGTDKLNDNIVGTMDFSGGGRYKLQKMPPPCSATQAAPCLPGGTLPDGVYISPDGRLFHDPYDNIGPRFGLAYRWSDKLALRASYGRFYDNWSGVNQISSNPRQTWPSGGSSYWLNLNQFLPTVFAQEPQAGGSITYPADTPWKTVRRYTAPEQMTPYADQWNLGFQRGMGSNTVLSANYVGSKSSRLDVGGMFNTATPGPGDQALRRPFPKIASNFYDRPIGRGTYHAFQFSLDRKSSHGLAYLLAYTWGKALDSACSGYFSEDCWVQDPNHIDNDKGPSGYDLTHTFSFSWVFASPFGKGQRWGGSRAVNYVLGNWKVNGITSLHSGQPYFVMISGDRANTGGQNYLRLNVVGDPKLSNPTPEQWFNRAAFEVPAPYTFGNEGRNSLRTDWARNLDVSLFRDFPITESKRFEFRAEAFNAFNTPQFGIPIKNYNDPSFAHVFNTVNVERQIQFALKFYF